MPGSPVVEELRLPSGPVHGNHLRPEEPHRGTAVVVIAGSGGGDAVSSATARALAPAGFPALGVGYFKVPGCPDELRDIPVEYFVRAVDAVRDRTPPGTPVVALGSSRGSEAALLLASHFPGVVDGVIGLVPADVAGGSWPPGGAGWTLHDRPAPFAGSPDAERRAEAAIPIERFAGPVLLVSAGRDEIWPSAAMATALEERLVRHQRSCVHLSYPDAGHALSFVATVADPSARPADTAAREDAWPRVLEFLENVGASSA